MLDAPWRRSRACGGNRSDRFSFPKSPRQVQSALADAEAALTPAFSPNEPRPAPTRKIPRREIKDYGGRTWGDATAHVD